MESPDSVLKVEAAEKLIHRWDSNTSEEPRERMIFDGGGNHHQQAFLKEDDEIQRSVDSVTLSGDAFPGGGGGCGGDSGEVVKGAVQISMANLEDEFRDLLTIHNNPVDFDSILKSDSFSIHSTRSSSSSIISDLDIDFGYPEDDGGGGSVRRINSRREELLDGEGSTSSRGDPIPRYRASNSIREISLIPSEAIRDLRSVAQKMVAAGNLRQCAQVYGSVRKSAIDASFRRLGIEKLGYGDVQRLEWNILESKIKRWIRAAKICVRILFASEKLLCEQIFVDLAPGADDACFMEAVKGPAIQLLNFAEAISISRRSPEKLFKMIDLYDTLSELLPDFDAVFRSKSSDCIRIQAAEIRSRFAEGIRGILSEFENAVQRETSKVPVPGGTIHPLTRYVMNYINLISDYKQTLQDLIVSIPSTGLRFTGDSVTPDLEIPEAENRSPLAIHMVWIILILQSNIEAKSKLYKDGSLAHIFLMNNVHYIVQKVKKSPELQEMIGDNYVRKLMGKFRQAATTYQRSTWVRILHSLRDEGLHVSGSFSSSGVSKTALRERFKNFNAMFEEVHRTQATWLVPEPQLREELRISISEKLLPAYRGFLGRFKSNIESWKHPEMYIKYSVDDIEMAVLDFFEGQAISQSLRKR